MVSESSDEVCGCTRDHEHSHEAWCYQNGGRCEKCRAWRKRRYDLNSDFAAKQRYLRGVDVQISNGRAVRKLRALARMGWGAREIARRIGKHARPVTLTRSGGTSRTRLSTMQKIDDVYLELHMVRNDTREGRITATRAENNGWLAPFDWDDIERGIEG